MKWFDWIWFWCVLISWPIQQFIINTIKPYGNLVSSALPGKVLLGVYLVSWAEAHREDGVARQRQGLLDLSVSFCVYLWEAFHLYNKSSPERAVSGYEKGAKNEMMSDSHGKNRSYVKINLSVVQHLLHKPEEKKKEKSTREKTLSPSEALSVTSLSFLWHCEAMGHPVRGSRGFSSWVASMRCLAGPW